jgi:hypothetical protein
VNERWIRLNATFDESQWLVNLPPLPRLIWPVVLAYVKIHGAKGVCKIPNLARWCAGKDLPLDAVLELLDAAVADGAMRLNDNVWTIVNWETYQRDDSTGYERLKRHRKKRQQAERQVQNDNGMITDDNALSSGDNGLITPDNAPDIDIDIDIDNPPLSPKGEKKRSPKVSAKDRALGVYQFLGDHLRSEDVYNSLLLYFQNGKATLKTEVAYKMLAKKLNEFQEEEVIAACENGIAANHQSLYPKAGKGLSRSRKSEFDDLPVMDAAYMMDLVS